MANPAQFNILDFVGDEEIKLPEGGTFQPRGLVAPFVMGAYYAFLREGSDKEVDAALRPDFAAQAGQSAWWTFYYADPIKARAAAKALGIKGVNMRYRFESETKDVVNSPNMAKLQEGFGDIVSFEVDVNTLASNKKRHEFHMFFLPSVVATVAQRYGYITEPYDLSEFATAPDDFKLLMSDEYHAKMIGSPDVRDPKEPNHWKNSVMWQRRKALWAALDEPNDEAYETKGSEGKYATTSDKLNNCLLLIARGWKRAHWVRLAQINDPSMDGKRKDTGGPGRLVVLTNLFDSKEQAVEATASEREAKPAAGGNGAAPAAAAGSTKPAMPKEWVNESEDTFVGAFADLVKSGKGNSEIAAEMGGMTVRDVIAWKTFLQL